MNNFNKILSTLLIGAAMLSSCSDEVVQPSVAPEHQDTDMPVLFSAGSEMTQGATRAADIIYVPGGVRFVADMYYQKSDNYVLTPFMAYLQVDNAGGGNSNYRQSDYAVPVHSKLDNYGNDTEGTIFYWQNRSSHIFIGYIDNYNAAYLSAKAPSQTYVPDALNTHDEYSIIEDQVEIRKQKCKHFDLRNPKDKKPEELKAGETAWQKMSDQYDPLIACIEKQPAGSGAEANRVELVFRHQFSQIVVNLKGHESVDIDNSQIESVELLGISESADVFPFVDVDTTQATPTIVKYNGGTSYIRTAEAGKVNKDDPYATSFDMFVSANTATTYLKTFEAIAYGQLKALRIVWHEKELGTDGEQIKHIVTFKIEDPDFTNLKSGKRYVYNLEIRRGTLAVVRTVIDDWEPYSVIYNGDGTIKN